MALTGYRENLFFNLSPEEKEELSCSICCHILRDPYQCRNRHQFCYYCIKTWTNKGQGNAHDTCPVCRAEGVYQENRDLEERISKKVVRCDWGRCFWTGPLYFLDTHIHTLYLRRRKRDVCASLERRLKTDRSDRSEESRESQNESERSPRSKSESLERAHVQSEGRYDKIYKQIIENEYKRIRNRERFQRKLRREQNVIREEDLRLSQRLLNVEIRKYKEIEENKRRVKSLELKKEQFRETSLRKSQRKEKELQYENQLQQQRIERLLQRKATDKNKTDIRTKEVEKFVRERTETFLRKLARDEREWNDKLAAMMERIERANRKKTEDFRLKQIDIKVDPSEHVQKKRPKTFNGFTTSK